MVVKSVEPERMVYKTTVTPAEPVDWSRVIDERIMRERKFLIEVMGRALGEKLEDERAALKADRADEIRQLKIEVANLETTVAELRQLLATDRAKAELPPRATIQ